MFSFRRVIAVVAVLLPVVTCTYSCTIEHCMWV